MGGWIDGCKSLFMDWLQQSKIEKLPENSIPFKVTKEKNCKNRAGWVAKLRR